MIKQNRDVLVLNDTKQNQDNGLIIHNNSILKNTLRYDILKQEEIGVNSLHNIFKDFIKSCQKEK